MMTQTNIDSKAFEPLAQRTPVPSGSPATSSAEAKRALVRVVNPARIYAGELALRIEALRAANGLGAVSAPSASEILSDIVKEWTLSYFLPLLGRKPIRTEKRWTEEFEEDDVTRLRSLSRPRKSLRLPLVFAVRETP